MALYHKHRPQTFANVVGQEHIVTTLTNQIENNRVAHAYLFCGPRGVGKTTLARLVAKAVTCKKTKDSGFEPDNTDPHAIEINESRSIDVIEIDAASNTGVENVRENIIENVQFKPTILPYKVFIIDEVHMLSSSAFNALLKTLEEPPSHVIFILATTELHKVPETIISRCQRFTFKRVSHDTMKEHLRTVAKIEKVAVEDEVLERIVEKSDGCVRDAVSFLDQLMAIDQTKITAKTASLILPTSRVDEALTFVLALVEKEAPKALEILGTLEEEGVSLPSFGNQLLELLRYMLIASVSGETEGRGLDYSRETEKQLIALAKKVSGAELVRLIDLTLLRKNQIQAAPLPQLPLEMLVVEWCSFGETSGIAVSVPASQSSIQDTKPSVVEKVKEFIAHKPFASLEEVQEKWDEVIKRVETKFPSLSFVLKMAQLQTVSGHTIGLAVPYEFHKDKLQEKSFAHELQSILSEIFGRSVLLEISVVEEIAQSFSDATSPELLELAAAFGGEVVE